MGVTLEDGIVCLRGTCAVEDAEALLGFLHLVPAPVVSLQEARHLHAAVVQLLLAFRPVVTGTPRDAFLERWLMPLLVQDRGG